MGGDWFTFPSHFFLPTPAKLEFIYDGFNGQLPAHFASVNGTFQTPKQPFNNLNKMEKSRFVTPDQCDFIVLHMHRDGDMGALEQRIRNDPNKYFHRAATLVLDPVNSPTLSRAFYIPNYSTKHNSYNEYALFQLVHIKG
jgi:alpha-1,2-mannosyltransferase